MPRVRSGAYFKTSARGTWDLMTCPLALGSTERTRPRRPFRSPITSPMYSSGPKTSMFMIGSRRTGLVSMTPFLKAMEEAILKAISEESTSWDFPS